MSNTATPSQAEFLAMRRLAHGDGAPHAYDRVMMAMAGKRFVRWDHDRWVFTIEGHLAYVSEVAREAGAIGL